MSEIWTPGPADFAPGSDQIELQAYRMIFARTMADPQIPGLVQRFSEVLEMATAELLADGNARGWGYLAPHRFPRRVTDSTAVSNSTTFVNDDTLKVTIGANRSYRFHGQLLYTTTAVAGIKFTFTIPSGASITAMGIGPWDFSVDSTEFGYMAASGDRIGRGFGGRGASVAVAWVSGTGTIGATQGDLQLQLAQNNLEVSDTKLLIGSYLAVTLY